MPERSGLRITVLLRDAAGAVRARSGPWSHRWLALAVLLALSVAACQRTAAPPGNWQPADSGKPPLLEGTIGLEASGRVLEHPLPLPSGMKYASVDKEQIRRSLRHARWECLPRVWDGGAVPPLALRVEVRGKKIRVVSEQLPDSATREGTETEECIRKTLAAGVLGALKKDEAMDIWFPVTCSLGRSDE